MWASGESLPTLFRRGIDNGPIDDSDISVDDILYVAPKKQIQCKLEKLCRKWKKVSNFPLS